MKRKYEGDTEQAVNTIAQRYRTILNREIPNAVVLGYNRAFEELYDGFVFPRAGDGDDFTTVNTYELCIKIKTIRQKTKALRREIEKDVIDNTYIPPENLELLKKALGDNFDKYFIPKDGGETADE